MLVANLQRLAPHPDLATAQWLEMGRKGEAVSKLMQMSETLGRHVSHGKSYNRSKPGRKVHVPNSRWKTGFISVGTVALPLIVAILPNHAYSGVNPTEFSESYSQVSGIRIGALAITSSEGLQLPARLGVTASGGRATVASQKQAPVIVGGHLMIPCSRFQ